MEWYVVLLVCVVVGGVMGEEEATKLGQKAVWGYSEVSTATNFLKFDEDMYLSDDLFCLPRFDASPNATCLPCTYSEDVCPSHVDPFSSQFSEETQIYLSTLPLCPCDEEVCASEQIDRDNTVGVSLSQTVSKLFRYEHNSWDQGFVIKKRSITEFSPTIVVSTDRNFGLDKVVAESSLDHIQVCPSHPLFGQKENTVTYYIFLQSSRETTLEITIESLSTDEGIAPPTPFFTPVSFVFWFYNYDNLDQGANTQLPGNYFVENFGRAPRDVAPRTLLYPIEECGLYSIQIEMTKYDSGGLLSSFLYTGVLTETEAESLGIRPGTGPPCDDCFKAQDFLNLDSQLLRISSDAVYGFCPQTTNETNYIGVFVNAPDSDWEMNIFVRKAENSPFISSHPISDPAFSHVQIQERLASTLILQFPCREEQENCEQYLDSSYLSFASRRNLVTPDYFPSLLYPLPGEPAASAAEDLVDILSFQTSGGYFLRCLDRQRDSACGLLSTYPVGDFASPLLYPSLEPIRSLEPLPSLVAKDLSPLFPRRADRLSLVTFLGVSDIPVISEQRFEEGSLIFANPNPLHTKNYAVPAPRTYDISHMEEEPPSVCSYETFRALYEFMQYLHEVLQAAQNGETSSNIGKNDLEIDPRTANYWAYTMLWTREWQSCWDNAAALVDFGVRVTPRENTTLCADNNPLDPCCNPRLEWSECCSSEGRDAVSMQWLPLSVDEDALKDNCLDADCMETFAEDYREIYQSAIGDKICVVNDEIFTNNSVMFRYCITRFIGNEPRFGIDCQVDSDCNFLGDPEGYCDLSTQQCVVDLTAQQNSFLSCLIDQMDSVTKSLVYEELVREGFADPKNTTGDIFLTASLLRAYSVDGEYRCFSDYGPLYNHYPYFTLRTLPTTSESTCPVCDEDYLDLHCLTKSCDYPVQCSDASSTCVNNLILVQPDCPSPSSSSFVCNWNNSLSETECNSAGEEICMYCFTDSNCVTAPGGAGREECEERDVCVLNDGEVLWDVGEEECGRMGKCEGGDGTTEGECIGGGECEDPDHILESIEALIVDFPDIQNATKGVCVTPLQPGNSPPCPRLRDNTVGTLDFTTQRGCIRIAECAFIRSESRTICAHHPSTEEECAMVFNGTWLTLPIQSKQDCENPLRVNNEDFPGYCRLSEEDSYLSARNRSDCEECGGEPEPPATWTKPTWRGGQAVQAQWRKVEMVPPYQYVSDSISFLRLQTLFDIAANNYENFILWTGESCLINPFLNYLDIVACDCADGSPPEIGQKIDNPFDGFNLESPECRSSLESEEIGTLYFCSDTDLEIGVISGIVGSLNEYVSGDLCFFSDIILAPTSDFVGNRPSEPITVTNDPNDLDPSPVRNKKGASVGTILGDGVGFLLSENVQPVDWPADAGAVRLRFSVDVSVFENMEIPSWYILDFGMEVVDPELKTQPSDEIEVQPVGSTMGLTVGRPVSDFLSESEDERLPIRIDGVLLAPFRYDETARIYPIARLPDWEEENNDEALDTGEVAMIGVFTGLYGIAFLMTLFFLVKGIYALTLSLLILFLYILATFAFRTVYWAIVASGGYEETSAGYYILIEPPSFFIVSVLTVLIMSYAFIVAASQGENKLGVYWMYWLILQLFLIAVLFVVVGLMIGLDNNDVITISCFGRQSSVEENTTIRDIRIAYHSFLLFVAIIGAIIVIKLGRDLPDHDNKTTLQSLSALAGLAVVLTSLLWVIYSAIDDPSPYFVIPLFFTEVPPLILMCYLTFPSNNEAMEADLDL